MEKIFLFDIGNIILMEHNYQMIYEKMKCTCTFDEFKKYFRESDYFYDLEKGKISTYKFIELLKEDTGSEIGFDEYIKVHCHAKGRISTDSLNLIESLHNKGYKVGILSNLKKIDVDHFKTIFDTNILDYEFYSCYLNDMKPSLELFNHVTKVTGAKENEVYFFDDIEENCENAKKVGIKAICTTGDTILEDFKKYVNIEGEL